MERYEFVTLWPCRGRILWTVIINTMGPRASSTNQELFPHRDNCDGTFDSICPVCFRTVAKKKSESDLQAVEREHVCNEEDLLRLETGLAENSVDTLPTTSK